MEKKDYLDLITSEYSNKPLFYGATDALLTLAQGSSSVLENFWEYFDLDKAVGKQLDLIGEYFSLSRYLPEVTDPLSDDTYRLLLKARSLQFRWDGSYEGLYNIYSKLFPDSVLLIEDLGDMACNFSIPTGSVPSEVVPLFQYGYLLPKPMGVNVNYDFVDKKRFRWDTEETTFDAGWDIGSWFV